MNELTGSPSADSLPSVNFTPVRSAPMTFGQTLDRIYHLMRAHLRLFLGVASVPAGVMLFYVAAVLCVVIPTMLGQIREHTPGIGSVAGFSPWFIPLILVFYPILLAMFALYLPAAVFASTQADLGVKVTVKQAYGAAWSHFGRYVWLLILTALSVVLPVAVLVALIATVAVLLGLGHSNPAASFFLVPLILLFYLAILIYSVVVMIRLAASIPACVEEGITAWAAIQRSLLLTRNSMGRVFLVVLVVYAIVYAAYLVSILLLLALGALVGIAAMAVHVTVGSVAFVVLVGIAVLAYLALFVAYILLIYSAMTTALAVLYHDLRRRLDNAAPAQQTA